MNFKGGTNQTEQKKRNFATKQGKLAKAHIQQLVKKIDRIFIIASDKSVMLL